MALMAVMQVDELAEKELLLFSPITSSSVKKLNLQTKAEIVFLFSSIACVLHYFSPALLTGIYRRCEPARRLNDP